MVDSVQGLFPYLQCVADILNFWHLYPAQFHESHKFLPNDFFLTGISSSVGKTTLFQYPKHTGAQLQTLIP